MFSRGKTTDSKQGNAGWQRLVPALAICLVLVGGGPRLRAQDQSNNPPPQGQDNGKPKQDAPADAGGPGDSVGPYAIPKKKVEEAPPPPPPPPKKAEDIPDYSLKVNVPLVNVDVMVTTKDGQFIPNLTKENFRVSEDGVPQTVSKFNISNAAPVTSVLLIEFASTSWPFMVEALQASYAFANTLRKEDWTAVSYYDMQPHILVDFTQDKRAVFGALNTLRIPGFIETNLFDALYDTLDRLDRVEGKKYIILVTTGFDSFSKLTLDKITKKIKDTKDVTIFPISVGWQFREYCEVHRCTSQTHGMGIPISMMDYLQADNEMKTFAAMTGGRAFFPRFQAEYAEIFHDVGDDIRHEYSLSYTPSNTKLDGTYRKLKVQVVAPDGGPLKVRDQKGKDVKFEVVSRDGYTAKHTVD